MKCHFQFVFICTILTLSIRSSTRRIHSNRTRMKIVRTTQTVSENVGRRLEVKRPKWKSIISLFSWIISRFRYSRPTATQIVCWNVLLRTESECGWNIRVKFPCDCLEARLTVNWTTSGQPTTGVKHRKCWVLRAQVREKKEKLNEKHSRIVPNSCEQLFCALLIHTTELARGERFRIVPNETRAEREIQTNRKLRANFCRFCNEHFHFQLFPLPNRSEPRELFLLRWRHRVNRRQPTDCDSTSTTFFRQRRETTEREKKVNMLARRRNSENNIHFYELMLQWRMSEWRSNLETIKRIVSFPRVFLEYTENPRRGKVEKLQRSLKSNDDDSENLTGSAQKCCKTFHCFMILIRHNMEWMSSVD